MKGLLCLLEERLVGHDNNRKEVQDQLQEMCAKTMEELDLLEEKINEEMHITFEKTEERILSLIEKLNNKEENDDKLNSFIKQALKEVSNEQKYEIQHTGKTGSLVGSYKLIVLSVKAKKKGNLSFKCDTTSRIECTISKLQKHLKKNHTSMIAAQNKLTEICSKKRMEINEVNNRINEKLERYFIQEDARIQGVVGLIRQSMDTGNVEDIDELSIKAKAVLVLVQRYELYDISGGKQDSNYDLIITRDVSLKLINFEERKPSNFIISFTNRGGISFSFSFFSNNEIEVLKQYDLLMKLTIITGKRITTKIPEKLFLESIDFGI